VGKDPASRPVTRRRTVVSTCACAGVRVGRRQVNPATTWIAVDPGGAHTCSTRIDGTLWCWGNNYAGQLGLGDTTLRTRPTQVGTATGWSHVESGYNDTCAVRDPGTLWCWGFNVNGELGVGDATTRSSPTQVGAATMWTKTAPDDLHTCAVRGDGSLWCWGNNKAGQLGVGTRSMETAPRQVPFAQSSTTGNVPVVPLRLERPPGRNTAPGESERRGWAA
jgi:alpha-tubulin suppressor-like RCC1 family protein